MKANEYMNIQASLSSSARPPCTVTHAGRLLDSTFRCDWLMSLKNICLREAHHTIFPLHHLFIYLAVTSPWSVRAHTHKHAHKCRIHSAHRDDAPATVATGATFSLLLLDRTEDREAPFTMDTHAPVRANRRVVHCMNVARTSSAPKMHIPAAFVCSDPWSVQVGDGGRPRTKRAVITNSAFRDEFSTACAALCVHAL